MSPGATLLRLGLPDALSGYRGLSASPQAGQRSARLSLQSVPSFQPGSGLLYVRLQSAYQAECERQMRLLQHEIKIAKAKGLADTPGYRAAEALVGEGEEEIVEGGEA